VVESALEQRLGIAGLVLDEKRLAFLEKSRCGKDRQSSRQNREHKGGSSQHLVPPPSIPRPCGRAQVRAAAISSSLSIVGSLARTLIGSARPLGRQPRYARREAKGS